MKEVKNYLQSRIENIKKEIKSGKNKVENIKKKEDLMNILFFMDLMDKHNINSKNILEVVQIETATTSSEIRLFDDCDAENKKYWKAIDNLRLSRGDIVIKSKF